MDRRVLNSVDDDALPISDGATFDVEDDGTVDSRSAFFFIPIRIAVVLSDGIINILDYYKIQYY